MSVIIVEVTNALMVLEITLDKLRSHCDVTHWFVDFRVKVRVWGFSHHHLGCWIKQSHRGGGATCNKKLNNIMVTYTLQITFMQ